MQTNLNLLDSTSNKINDKINMISKLRKEIINYTNNYREFKLLKSDIIETFLDNENDLRQLDVIIKTVSNQNYIQRETIDDLNNKINTLQNSLKISEKEISSLNLQNETLQEEIKKLNNSNETKDLFIHDLLSKVNFLENVIRDYQRRIYISRYDKMFTYKSPFKNAEELKKFYDNNLPRTAHEISNSQYHLMKINNFSNSNTFEKIIQKEFNSLGKKQNKANNKLKERPSTSNFKDNLLSAKENETDNNKEADFNALLKDKKESSSITDKLIKSSKNLQNNENYKENDNKNNKNNLLPKTPQSNTNSDDCKSVENNKSNFPSNELYPNKGKSENNQILIKDKISLEKERADLVSSLLLKIFSAPKISRILKRKFGESYEIKLTDKDVDPKFIYMIETEINQLMEIEKQREFSIKSKYDDNIRRKRSMSRSSNSRAISPFSDREENYRTKESFNHYTKRSSGYFDPKLQYGGESCVPGSTRPKLNERERISYNLIEEAHKKRLD